MKFNKILGYCALIKHMTAKQLIFRARKKCFKHNSKYKEQGLSYFYISEIALDYDFKTYSKYMDSDFMLADKIINEGILMIQNIKVDINSIDWDKENNLLVIYELNYFDYGKSLVGYYIKTKNKKAIKVLLELMISWIESSKKLMKILWDPYPTSRRIWNWIMILKYLKAENLLNERQYILILNSIYAQMKFLNKTLEYDLNNNHLTANAKTMLLCGLFFRRTKWALKGKSLLRNRIIMEISEYGFHDERSMSYHMGAMLDYAEIYVLLKDDDNLKKMIYEKVNKMADALMYMLKPDGFVPLISDTVKGYPCKEGDILNLCAILLGRRDLKRDIFNKDLKWPALIYGKRKIDELRAISEREYDYKDLKNSGNIILRNEDLYLYFNCVPFGPVHCPGHNHCDALSIVLNYRGCDIFVDSGVYSYSAQNDRTLFKSTSSHNTVQVGQLEQFEILGNFRVGRISNTGIDYFNKTEEYIEVQGFLDEYRKKYVHKRKLKFSCYEKYLEIYDRIEDCGDEKVTLNFSIAKNIELKNYGNKIEFYNCKSIICIMYIENDYTIENSFISEEWNKKISIQKIVIKANKKNKLRIKLID